MCEGETATVHYCTVVCSQHYVTGQRSRWRWLVTLFRLRVAVGKRVFESQILHSHFPGLILQASKQGVFIGPWTILLAKRIQFKLFPFVWVEWEGVPVTKDL